MNVEKSIINEFNKNGVVKVKNLISKITQKNAFQN